MDKPKILSCLKDNPDITLVALCEKLGVNGSLDQVGQTGTLIGEMLRDRKIVRDESKQYPNWTLRVNERENNDSAR